MLLADGWVGGEDAGLLAREGTRLLAASRRLVLELAGLMAVDAAGLALREQWAGPRLVLQDGSPFAKHLLERHHLRCEEGGGRQRAEGGSR